ncbi:MAG TPA: hypothetical protein VK327_00025 [Candidatus Paceibacterota bacterium]|nr:hypothetical protein [Candidatus Paceibacterota bacterium]
MMIAAVLFAIGEANCRKAFAETVAPAVQAHDGSQDAVMRIHWLGKSRIGSDTNAAGLMAIWNLPETHALQRQTLEKLSSAPWRLMLGDKGTNAAGVLLQPILNDIVDSEFYLETRGFTNQPAETVFAIRLNAGQAALWETNLARVVESLTRIRPDFVKEAKSGWTLKKHDAPNLIEFKHVGDWVLIGLAQNRNALLGDWAGQLNRTGAPFAVAGKTNWVEAYLDFAHIPSALPFLRLDTPFGSPKISFALSGNGKDVLTKAEFQLKKSVGLLKPWNVPTNLIDGNFVGFTAVRGLDSELGAATTGKLIKMGSNPDQAYVWSLPGVLMATYFAAPDTQASNKVERLTTDVLKWSGTYFKPEDLVQFERSHTFNGLEWKGVPFVSPFVRSIETNNADYIFGGFFNFLPPDSPFPQALEALLKGNPNLVAYDWELTGRRIDQGIYVGQFVRMALHKAQLPSGSPGLLWLQAMAARLGNSATEVVKTAPDQLALNRKSTIGLTSLEVHLLVDWLESPDFPRGLHTFRAKPEPQP